ncbi:hypothetical protein R3P38DRAFT_3470680 [Favolaschia claudopus]|uniref:Uncharacterized protein n=1 Tax=Favolaschia claudopus TaxID=2862362 RepID=A0AAV9ZCW8_9AGAR
MINVDDDVQRGLSTRASSAGDMSSFIHDVVANHIIEKNAKARRKYRLDQPDGTANVREDEVCITVTGLNDTLRPEFYHRDQYIQYGVRLNKISVNYHGNLTLSPDRMGVVMDHKLDRYRRELSLNMDLAFATLPDLAVELAADILTDDHSDSFAGMLDPAGNAAADKYREAFEAAMLREFKPLSQPIYPYTEDDKDVDLLLQLGLHGVLVPHYAFQVMRKSGAFLPIADYARALLLQSPEIEFHTGLEELRATLLSVLPHLPRENITIRAYDKTYPLVVWDAEKKLFAFAHPPACEMHPVHARCLCWIGPAVSEAARVYTGSTISNQELWRTFAIQMGGNTTVKLTTMIQTGVHSCFFPLTVAKTIPAADQVSSPVNNPISTLARQTGSNPPDWIDDYPGLDVIRSVFKSALPVLASKNILMCRTENQLWDSDDVEENAVSVWSRRVVWSADHRRLIFVVLEGCIEHDAGRPGHCFCWIVPALLNAVTKYGNAFPAINVDKLWIEFAHEMGGDIVSRNIRPSAPSTHSALFAHPESVTDSGNPKEANKQTPLFASKTSGYTTQPAKQATSTTPDDGPAQSTQPQKSPRQTNGLTAQSNGTPRISDDSDESAMTQKALTHLTKVVGRFDGMHNENKDLRRQIAGLNESLVEKTRRMSAMDERIAAKDGRIAELEEDVRGFRDFGNLFTQNMAQFAELNDRASKRQRTA